MKRFNAVGSGTSRRTNGSSATALTTTENTSRASAQPGCPACQRPSEASPKTSVFTTGRVTGPPYGAFGEANAHHTATTARPATTASTGPPAQVPQTDGRGDREHLVDEDQQQHEPSQGDHGTSLPCPAAVSGTPIAWLRLLAMTAAMYVPQFFVRQKFTMMVNRYEIFAANPDGSQGPLMALAEQKRMAFKEQVTFFTDESKTRPVFGFKARQKLDLNAGYDITDEQRPADRLLPQGLRRQPAALDLPRRGPGLRRHRAGAQPARRAAAPVHRLPVPADPLRLRRPRRATSC